MDSKELNLKCPCCGKPQTVLVPVSVASKQTGISTIQVNAACGHRFDIYIDVNFQIRGFHRPDFTIISQLANVDKKLSSLLTNQQFTENEDGKNINDYKNYFDGDGFLDSFTGFDTVSEIDVYSKTKLLGVLQVPGDPDSKVIVSETPKIARSKVDAKESKAQLAEIKRQYELRMQKVRDLMKNQSAMTNEEKAKLLEIKKDLDAFQKQAFRS
ncbi:MAG TPA: hypothetical protein VKM55_15360 [Candidatus Lokiarchaeia archaeon]|nr:hypothetical protein [Candidatus Lokiarchaeia archaeon]